MKTIYVNGKEIQIEDDIVNQIRIEHPKMVYFVSPEGIVSEYNIAELENSVNGGHHYMAYLRFAKDLIEVKDDQLSFEIVPLLQKMDLLIQKIPENDKLNKRERIECYISNEIRSLLLEHHYFIAEGWLNEFDLKNNFILTPFQKASEIQRESILKLYFELELDTYVKTSVNDANGIVLEKYMIPETIKKK